jgi:hypothetical protein
MVYLIHVQNAGTSFRWTDNQNVVILLLWVPELDKDDKEINTLQSIVLILATIENYHFIFDCCRGLRQQD